MKYKIKVKQVQDDKVVYEYNGKEITIPKEIVLGKAQVGDTWYFSLTDDQYGDQSPQLAKDILNEILDVD